MSRLRTAWDRYRRENRFLLVAFVVLLLLALGAMYLLQRTQVASPRELTNRLLLFVLWYLDISLILVLSFILVRNMVRLAVERRAGVLGSRFRTKLVLTYVALTFIPVIFIFLIATNLLQRSIDRWFSSPVEEILRGGAAVTIELRELVEDRLVRQAARAATELADDPSEAAIHRLHGLMGVDLLALYDGPRLLGAVADPRRIPQTLPPLELTELQDSGVRADRWRGGLLVRAWCPTGTTGRVVVVGDMLPRDVLLHLERATAADATFQEMKLERSTITSTTLLVFLAITLLLLFATVWVGLYLSRRFTEPLLAVAAATQRVAEGDELEEVEAPANDEVAALVHSFNAMVRRVRATEAEIRSSNEELSTLLATVPIGVLSVNDEPRRFRPNPAAASLLGHPEWEGAWQNLDALDRPGLSALFGHLSSLTERAAVQLILEPTGTTRQVEVTVRSLPGGGRVVALDDRTQLVRAQRQAAWSEVARRIAHEIKNPLTPIRLAAERIQRHGRKLSGELGAVVSDGCDAIIAHVAGLKELVDAFSQYARMPTVNPKPTLLNRLLREVTSLYQGLRDGLVVQAALPPTDPTVLLDPALLRQALVNLLDNAVEAIPATGSITLTAAVAGPDLEIVVADSGEGVPTDDTEMLVQPFFSTKGRGSGMGLALVHRIVTDHGGELEIRSLTPNGTEVRLRLPGSVLPAEGDDPAGHISPPS